MCLCSCPHQPQRSPLLSAGNIFHVKVISRVNLLNEHALIRFCGYAGDGNEASRIMELYNPVTEEPIYVWRLDKIRQFVRTDVGIRVDLCQNCFRTYQQPHSHTFMLPTYFLDKCLFFLCREVGSMNISVTQTNSQVGGASTAYQITTHTCTGSAGGGGSRGGGGGGSGGNAGGGAGGRLNPPPTSPPPPPPPEVPQKRTKRKPKPIPPRDIPRLGYADATEASGVHISQPVQPYVVSKRIHIDDWGNTVRLADNPPHIQVTPYHSTTPVIRPLPRHRTRDFASEMHRDAFWRHSQLDPSPNTSPVFGPVNWTYMPFKSETLPPMHQQSGPHPLNGFIQQEREEKAAGDGDTEDDSREYYNWSPFRSAMNKLPTSPIFTFDKDPQPPPLPPRLPPRSAKSRQSAQCHLRSNQSMKITDRQYNSQDYFMEKDSMVGVVPSVDFTPSSESTKFLPDLEEYESPLSTPQQKSRMKQREKTPDYSDEFDAFALDTMEEDSTPRGGSPVHSHSTPVSYSRMVHDGISSGNDVNADDIHPGYTSMLVSSYSKVKGPQYKNLGAFWMQGSPELPRRLRKGAFKDQTSVSPSSDEGGCHHGDRNLSHSYPCDHSQRGSRHFYFDEDSTATHQHPTTDLHAHTLSEVSGSGSFHVNAETGELSPIQSTEQIPGSKATQDCPLQASTSPSDTSSRHTSPQPPGAKPIPQTHARPADNPLYASSPPNSTLMTGEHPPPASGSAPPRSPKPLVRPKPVVNPASLHPSSPGKKSATVSQRGGQPATSRRPMQDRDTPSPPKVTKPTITPPPQASGSAGTSGGHSQAKLIANRSAGSQGNEERKAPSFGEQQKLLHGKTVSRPVPPPGDRHPPQPLPKPTRTIYH